MKINKGMNMKKYLLSILLLIMAFPAFATVSTETTRVAYTCNGTSTTYAYTFKILADADLQVIKTLTATGAETTLTLATDYTVTGAGTASGNVVLTAGSKCASGYTMTILRDMDVTQETDYVDGEAFSAQSIEDALDKNTMILQQLKEEVGRAPKLPTTSTITDIALPNPTANHYIGWNTTGTNLTNISNPVTSTATQYEIDALVTYGGGTAYTQATIEAALTAIGTTNKATLLLRPGTWVISSNADWSAYTNVTFKLVPGTIISHSSYDITFGSPPIIEGLSLHFAWTTGKVYGLKIACPEYWGGVVGASTATTTLAVQAAIDSLSPTVILQDRYYYVSTKIVMENNFQALIGTDPYKSGLLWDGAAAATVLQVTKGTGLSNYMTGVRVKDIIINSYAKPALWNLDIGWVSSQCEFTGITLYGGVGQIKVGSAIYSKFDHFTITSGYDGLPTGMTQGQWETVYNFGYAPINFAATNGITLEAFSISRLGASAAVGGVTPDSLVKIEGAAVKLRDWTVESLNGYASKATAVSKIFSSLSTGSSIVVDGLYMESVYAQYLGYTYTTVNSLAIQNAHLTACGFSEKLMYARYGHQVSLKNITLWDQAQMHATTAELVYTYDPAYADASASVENIIVYEGTAGTIGGKHYSLAAAAPQYGVCTGARVFPGGNKLPKVESGLTVTNGIDAVGSYVLIEPGVISDMYGKRVKVGTSKLDADGTGWQLRTGATAADWNVCVEPAGTVFLEKQTILRSTYANGKIVLATFTTDGAGAISALTSVTNTANGQWENNYTNKNVEGFVTLSDTGTPSVAGGSRFVTGGTTAITNFTSGYIGQKITIVGAHTTTTITDGATIYLLGGANLAMKPNDTIVLMLNSASKWVEISRSVN
jgi:hypothetical protein